MADSPRAQDDGTATVSASAAAENDILTLKRVFSAPMAKAFRRRASTACAYCQFRKIRCSVEEGMPCNNCKLEQIECRITKRRKTKHNKPLPTTQPAPVSQPTSTNTVSNVITIPASPQDLGAALQTDAQVTDAQVALSESHSNTGSSHDPVQAMAAIFPDLTRELAASNSLSPQSCRSSSALRDLPSRKPSIKPVFPSYIEAIPDHLAPDDLDYLQRKGAFDIPSDKFRNAALRSYSQFFQIYMPLLDIGDFTSLCTGTNRDSGGRQVSLLVFQAAMFAGCAHVDVKLLRSMGFLTRKAARQALFQRTKALYLLGYEQNRIPVIQTLLIMSFWYQTPDDQFDSFHWLQIALQLARRAGLDRDPSTLNIPDGEKRLRRRIWWCILIRDPLVALGTKRPISVPIEENQVAELTISDFEPEDNMYDGFAAVGLHWSSSQLRLIRLTCASQTRLHQCLSMILSKQYVMGDYHHARPLVDPKVTRAILLPVTTDEAWRNLPECEQRLRSWRDGLEPVLHPVEYSEDSPHAGFDAFLVFRNMLHMIYHTCIITLYRPWTTTGPSNFRQGGGGPPRARAFHDPAFQAKIRTAIRASAQSITELAVDLHKADVARHLPQTGLSAMVAAIVSHLSDAASGDEPLQEAALLRFEQCSHIINELRENYYSADFTGDFVNVMAQAKKVGLAQIQRSPARSGLPTFNMEEQSTATGTFLGEGTDSLSGSGSGGGSSDPCSLKRRLPEALFPQGTQMEFGIPPVSRNETGGPPGVVGQMNDDDNTNTEEEEQHHSVPANLMAGWDTYRDVGSGEESTRLFGDLFDDYELLHFTSIPGIDLGA